MGFSRRRVITNNVVTQLKLINGQVSTLNSNYTYLTNIFNNVFRGLKFIDEVNDYPSLYLQAAEETRFYETQGFTFAELSITLYAYVKSENPQEALENLIQDIEHIIYNFPDSPELNIADIIMESIITDEGLMDPFGIGEITISISYQIE